MPQKSSLTRNVGLHGQEVPNLLDVTRRWLLVRGLLGGGFTVVYSMSHLDRQTSCPFWFWCDNITKTVYFYKLCQFRHY